MCFYMFYRYQASLGEPPRGGYYPASSGDRRQYPYTGTNPWEREEKEKVTCMMIFCFLIKLNL